ncbi:DUF4082 domain-containing protein [Nonomuraea pusilla]|uniref:DUF4082 domain-containing protein n=1 Tax=Nonomuraea pusilla TaxID=46177 RepID=UPI00332229E6
MGVVVATPDTTGAQPMPTLLGTAAPFAVFGGSAVNNTNQTTVTGDLGVSPGTTVTGFPPGTVHGTIHAGDSTAATAKADIVSAYNNLAARTPTATIAPQLGGLTLTPGVYASTSGDFQITGRLVLDAQANPDALFIFKCANLTTATVSSIALMGGAQPDNVYWQLSTSGTLGLQSTFYGTAIAQSGITVNTEAGVIGRVFTLNNTIGIAGSTSGIQTVITRPDWPATTTTLSSAPNPAGTDEQITFTAVVQPVSPNITPEGQVVFKDGGTTIGTGYHSSLGPATLTTTLSPGQHIITAVYLGGDTFNNEQVIHFAPSTSAPITQFVTSGLWTTSDTPSVASQNDTQAVTVGTKFTSSSDGLVTGIRFYKGSANTGTHTVLLWTTAGQLLASATSTGETASGWQDVQFAAPVTIAAGTTYIAAYHTTSGRYSITRPYFTSRRVNAPLTGLSDAESGGNGVYAYGASPTFPTSSFQATSYWVDPMFVSGESLWTGADTPDVASQTDTQPVTVGVKFTSSSNGNVTALRFYKGSANTGTHTVVLWSNTGQALATATSTGETASGWQEVKLPSPVPVTAGTTYVASYHTTSGRYAMTRQYFATSRVNPPLTAPSDAQAGGNGVYVYGASPAFPTSSFQATNYWVDVVFAG